MSRIVTRDKDSINLDIGIKNKWNWCWLEKNNKCRCSDSCPIHDLERDSIIAFSVADSIRKENLSKQMHNMSTSNGVRNNDITKVQ